MISKFLTGHWICTPLLWIVLLTSSLHAQDNLELDSLLNIAGHHYNHDNLDSASFYYSIAINREDRLSKLQGITGLIKVNIFTNSFNTVDSLIHIGDQLIETMIYSKEIGNYEIMKGEYYRKNSRFQEALLTHKKTIKESSKLEDGQIRHADALLYTALTYEQLSKYDSSLIYADKAFKIFSTISDTASTRYGSISNSLGVCYYRANQLDKAKEFYLRAKRIAENTLGPLSSDLSNALSNLAALESGKQNYREAIKYTEQSLKINRALKDEDSMSTNYYSLGVYYYYLTDYGRAKDYLEACIEIRERIFNPTHSRLVWPYQVLGITLQESGNFTETIIYNNKARKILRANFGERSLEEGFLEENTAGAYLGVGQLDSALYYITKASDILINQLSEDDYSLGIHFFSRSNIHYMLEEYNQAQNYIEKSNSLFEFIGENNNTDYAQNLALRALIEFELRNHSLADSLFSNALQLIGIGESFEYSAPSFWVLGSYTDYLYEKYKINLDPKTLDDFERYSKNYLELSNKFRRQFNDPYTKSALILDNIEVYNRNIGIAYQLYQKVNDKKYLKMAFDFAESGRTSLLRDMQDGKIEKYSGVSDTLLSIEDALKKDITQLNQMSLEYPDSMQIRKDLFNAKESLNQHIESILVTNPKYFEARFNNTIPSIKSIKNKLEDGENIIEYMNDDTAYYALVINKEKNEFVFLGLKNEIDPKIKSWRKKIIGLDKSLSKHESFELYRSLVKPVEEFFEGNRLVIIPTGLLFYLNFEALNKNGKESSYLIYDYIINYGLSTNVLYSDYLAEENANSGVSISIAPGFEDDIKLKYKNKLDSLESKDEEFLHMVRQPWSVKLAHTIEKLYQSSSLTGVNANEKNVKNQINTASILYFGTHAITNPIDPIRSKLVLAKEIGTQEEDGYLHAYELFGLKLQADLAILNACETGIGNLKQGEGMISLAYSLHFAGCPSTVMSLWKVDEKISSQITESFVKNLVDGQTKSAALRNAKLSFLNEGNTQLSSPYYWSGLVLMGTDGNIQIDKKRDFSLYAIIFLGLLVILTTVLLRKKITSST